MINAEQVTQRLDEYKAYSIEQKPEFEAQYSALMAPIYSAVETYFATVPAGMKEALEELVHQSYCDTYNRTVQYENPAPVELPTDYPLGFDDVRKCFYSFGWMETTPEAFFAAWVEGVPEAPADEGGETGPTQPPEPISHPMVDAWVAEVPPQSDEDMNKVKALVNWFKSAASSVGMVNLLEDQGMPSNIPSTQDVARMIYIERHLLDVIKERNVPAYVPTYLRG